MATALVTGSNRGIGLELCKQLAARGDTVIAACRTTAAELSALPVEVIENVDVSDAQSVAALADTVRGRSIDLLINNAGILISDTLETLNFEEMQRQYNINALGPLRITSALLENLPAGAKVGIVSSRVGSIADNGSGNNYGYRASKTAVNMIGTNLKHDLAERDISVALLHPGLVATDMTGGRGVSAADAASGILTQMDSLDRSNSGSFWHAEGYILPW